MHSKLYCTSAVVQKRIVLIWVCRLLSRISAWDNGFKGPDSGMQYSYQRDQDSMSDVISIAASSIAPSDRMRRGSSIAPSNRRESDARR